MEGTVSAEDFVARGGVPPPGGSPGQLDRRPTPAVGAGASPRSVGGDVVDVDPASAGGDSRGRGGGGRPAGAGGAMGELEALRAEVAELRAERVQWKCRSWLGGSRGRSTVLALQG